MSDCIFCKIIRGEIPSYKVYEDEHTYAFFDINPKNEYHTLVIPKHHYVNMFDVPEEEAVAVMKTVKKLVDLFSEKLGISNAQIVNNSGASAQQDVFHLHFHIIPRFPDDGQNCKYPLTREDLREKFDSLLDALNKE